LDSSLSHVALKDIVKMSNMLPYQFEPESDLENIDEKKSIRTCSNMTFAGCSTAVYLVVVILLN